MCSLSSFQKLRRYFIEEQCNSINMVLFLYFYELIIFIKLCVHYPSLNYILTNLMILARRNLFANLVTKCNPKQVTQSNKNQLSFLVNHQSASHFNQSFFLSQKLSYAFSTSKIVNPYEKHLKSYFSHRFQFTKQNLLSTLKEVLNTALKHQKQKFNNHLKQKSNKNGVIIKFSVQALQKDHRWINLIIAMQNNYKQFNIQERFEIMLLLVRAGICNQLLTKVLSDTLSQLQMKTIDKNYNQYGEINDFTLQDACNLLWIVAKIKFQTIKNVQVINDFILNSTSKNVHFLKTKRQFEKVEDKLNNTIITPFGISQAIWAYGEAQVLDTIVIKYMSTLIKQNIEKFSISQACVLLKSFVTLGMTNKKITVFIVKQIVNNNNLKLLQAEGNQTLRNLLFSISHIRKSKIFQVKKCEVPQERQILRQELQQLQKFVYWLTETIIIKYQYHMTFKSSRILLYYLKRSRVPYNSTIHKPIFSQLINKNVQKMLVKELLAVQDFLIELYVFQNNRYLKQQSRNQMSRNGRQFSGQIEQLKSFLTVVEERLWSLYVQFNTKQKEMFMQLSYQFVTKPPKFVVKQFNKQILEYERNKAANSRKQQFSQANTDQLQRELKTADQQ